MEGGKVHEDVKIRVQGDHRQSLKSGDEQTHGQEEIASIYEQFSLDASFILHLVLLYATPEIRNSSALSLTDPC